MKKKKILLVLAILLIIAIIIALIIFYIYTIKNNKENIKTITNENNVIIDENKNESLENDYDAENETSENSENIQNNELENNSHENVDDVTSINDSNSSQSSNSSNSASNSNSSTNNGSNSSSSTTQPTHVHNWQDHTAQRWVSNIVTVVDTPAQTITGAQLYTLHSDGQWYGDGEIYWFENGFTSDDLKAILKDKIKNEGYIGNYVNRTKTIPAVTHEEDRGYYETYVDYQYCECGARREV